MSIGKNINNIICINKKEIMNSHEIAVDDVHCEQCKAYMRLEKSESGTVVVVVVVVTHHY